MSLVNPYGSELGDLQLAHPSVMSLEMIIANETQ